MTISRGVFLPILRIQDETELESTSEICIEPFL
jgi:hypothetical protein